MRFLTPPPPRASTSGNGFANGSGRKNLRPIVPLCDAAKPAPRPAQIDRVGSAIAATLKILRSPLFYIGLGLGLTSAGVSAVLVAHSFAQFNVPAADVSKKSEMRFQKADFSWFVEARQA